MLYSIPTINVYHEMLTKINLVTIFTIQSYYNIIDFIPYAILFILVIYLFCNQKFLPYNSVFLLDYIEVRN